MVIQIQKDEKDCGPINRYSAGPHSNTVGISPKNHNSSGVKLRDRVCSLVSKYRMLAIVSDRPAIVAFEGGSSSCGDPFSTLQIHRPGNNTAIVLLVPPNKLPDGDWPVHASSHGG